MAEQMQQNAVDFLPHCHCHWHSLFILHISALQTNASNLNSVLRSDLLVTSGKRGNGIIMLVIN
jgi:hypothetical protein